MYLIFESKYEHCLKDQEVNWRYYDGVTNLAVNSVGNTYSRMIDDGKVTQEVVKA